MELENLLRDIRVGTRGKIRDDLTKKILKVCENLTTDIILTAILNKLQSAAGCTAMFQDVFEMIFKKQSTEETIQIFLRIETEYDFTLFNIYLLHFVPSIDKKRSGYATSSYFIECSLIPIIKRFPNEPLFHFLVENYPNGNPEIENLVDFRDKEKYLLYLKAKRNTNMNILFIFSWYLAIEEPPKQVIAENIDSAFRVIKERIEKKIRDGEQPHHEFEDYKFPTIQEVKYGYLKQ